MQKLLYPSAAGGMAAVGQKLSYQRRGGDYFS
ncbi:hypothetical protein ACVWYF_003040 [Hymenobacter sp. UYAg731]